MTLAAPLAYPEAEAAVLGALLLAPERLIEVRPTLTAESFTEPGHARAWAAILRLTDAGKPIDHVTLEADSPDLGATWADLLDVASTANLPAHAALLADATQRRYAVRLADRLIARARDAGTPLADSLAGMVSAVAQVVTDGPFKPPTFRETLGAVVEGIGKPPAHGATRGLPTGLRGLDSLLDGFRDGLHVIAGNTSEGKSSLARWIARRAAEHGPVWFDSLEMSQEEIAGSLLESELGKSMKWLAEDVARLGHFFPQVMEASGVLANLPITIAEGVYSPAAIRMAWQAECALGRKPMMLVIDYLQLMRADERHRDRRDLDLGSITAGLKAFSFREKVPVVLLSQLSRENKKMGRKPRLDDLRDCLAGDTLLTDASTGQRLTVEEVVNLGLRPHVWALDANLQLARRPVVDAWRVGRREAFRLTSRTGRAITASAGHRFLTPTGWVEVRDLKKGDTVAVPRLTPRHALTTNLSTDRAELLGWLIGDGHMGKGTPTLTVSCLEDADEARALAKRAFPALNPHVVAERDGARAWRVILGMGVLCGAGRNPLTTWLRGLRMMGCTGASKHIPAPVFGADDDAVAACLRGLFHADGSHSGRLVRLATISERLAHDARDLLLRLGILSTVSRGSHRASGFRSRHGHIWSVTMSSAPEVGSFLSRVGFKGAKQTRALARLLPCKSGLTGGGVDRLPLEASALVASIREQRGIGHAQIGWRDQGKRMDRDTAARLGAKFGDHGLLRYAHSHVLWDTVSEITPVGTQEMYDVTVGDLHNFCADGWVTHNSGNIEQDASTVTLIHLPQGKPDSGPWQVDLILAKNRGGPTGSVRVEFEPWVYRYRDCSP